MSVCSCPSSSGKIFTSPDKNALAMRPSFCPSRAMIETRYRCGCRYSSGFIRNVVNPKENTTQHNAPDPASDDEMIMDRRKSEGFRQSPASHQMPYRRQTVPTMRKRHVAFSYSHESRE